MSSSAGHRHPQCHVLNFFYDKDDGCALTVLVNDVRFHIIADPSRLKGTSESGSKLARQYRHLLAKVKAADNDFTKPCSHENLRSFDSQDSGHDTVDEVDTDVDSDNDSAVDVKEVSDDPEKALHDWMLSPFGSVFEKEAPRKSQRKEQSVQDWYSGITSFFSLILKDEQLAIEEEKVSEDLEKRMVDIIPRMNLPKKLREMGIPWYHAKDVTVLDTSDNPAPYHPIRVRVGEKTYFIKMVDPTQPQPTKREIELMKRIESEGLHKKMRVPLVEGLVGFEDSKTQIMGFLQTEIEDPTPLTKMLDDDIPQSKRDKWADESERIKNLLHEHKIVWGDAKADNYMVDKHDNLWIIDFGGSYTDGWVDPELMETKEGDDMGVDRIVNALHDPNANTWDPEEHQTHSQDVSSSPSPRKRKAASPTDEDSENEGQDQADDERPSPKKRARRASSDVTEESADPETASNPSEAAEDTREGDEDDADQESHCLCNEPDSGDMVACDGSDCQRQWFHFECVGLKEVPNSKHWYCDDCKG